VVIRIARSEMGQGTLTGLAQLVAENWNGLSKVTTEYRRRPERGAQAGVGDFSTGGSPRHPHLAGIRPQGRRHRAHDAGAGRGQLVEGAGCGMHRGQQRHHPQPSGKTTTYGKVVEAAAKLEPPADADVKLKDPRTGRSPARDSAAGHPAKTTGEMTYGIDVKLPGMLNAAIKACPVFGGS